MSQSQDELFSGRLESDPSSSREPTAREVNRQIRAENRRKKDKLAISTRSRGELVPYIKEAYSAKREHDPHAQLNFLLSRSGYISGTGRYRGVAQKTRTDFGDTLHRAIKELKKIRMPILKIGDLRRVHVIALIKYWIEQGQQASTLQTKSSVLRKFLSAINKPEAMPIGRVWTSILAEQGIDVKKLRRSKIAKTAKAWSAKGIDAYGVIEKIAEQHPVVAIEMLVQLAFGMRVKESMMVDPATADEGNRIKLVDGVKNGLERHVNFDPDPEIAAFQRAALEHAKRIAAQHPKLILAIPKRTLLQMRNHYYYVLRKYGITKKGLGIVSHGLRHQYINRHHKSISGLPAPVLRAAPVQLYSIHADKVREAERDTSRQVGHKRPDVTGPYNSTVAHMSKEAKQELDAHLELFQESEGVAAAFQQACVQTAWFVGRLAYGMPIRPGMAIEMQVLVPAHLVTPNTEAGLRVRIEASVGRQVSISISTDPMKRPEDGYELIMAADR